MEMINLKHQLIDWTAKYIDYNADIDAYEGIEWIQEVSNNHQLAHSIVNHIFDALKDLSDNDFYWLMEQHVQDNTPAPDPEDIKLDQELDYQWNKVKKNLLFVYDEESEIQQEYWNLIANIRDQLGVSDRVTITQGPTYNTNSEDQLALTNHRDQRMATNNADQHPLTNPYDQHTRPTCAKGEYIWE